MSSGNIEASPTSEQLLRDVSQLSTSDLDQFVQRVLMLQAQRRAPCLPQEESELLLEINQSLPAPVLRRYDELIAKRSDEALNSQEYDELLRLTDQVEAHDTRRVESLVKLSLLRQVSLDQLMQELGIRSRGRA